MKKKFQKPKIVSPRMKIDTIPAIPPDDYKGSQAAWMVALQERGLWNGEGWYGDVEIPTDVWWEILEECEGDEDD